MAARTQWIRTAALAAVLILSVIWSRLIHGGEGPEKPIVASTTPHPSPSVTERATVTQEPPSKAFDYRVFEKIRSIIPSTRAARLVIDLSDEQYLEWKRGRYRIEDKPPVAGIVDDYDRDGQLDRALPVRVIDRWGQTQYLLLLATHYPDGRWRLYQLMGISEEDVKDPTRLRGAAEGAYIAGYHFRALTKVPYDWEKNSQSPSPSPP